MSRLLLFYAVSIIAVACVASCGAPPRPAIANGPDASISQPLSLSAGPLRGGNTPVFTRPKVYDYAPTLLQDGGIYRMWWCGGIAGDHILHAEASSLKGPWHAHNSTRPNSYDDTFAPRRNLADWDGEQTCDPSVIVVNGTYYLYYGGLPLPGSPYPRLTSVGVATSTDGLAFTRARKEPLVQVARTYNLRSNEYGAGQPTAFYRQGWFYLGFTDSTGPGANKANGGGVFVWRSQSGTFASGIEELKADGWAQLDRSNHSTYSIADTFSAEWAWSTALQRVVLVRSDTGGFSLYGYDHNLKRQADIKGFVPGTWHDGPGLVRTAYGHLPINKDGSVPIDILRAVTDASGNNSPNGWDLAWVGRDFKP